MSKYLPADGDVYDPAAEPKHPWADLFRDMPLKWDRVPGEGVYLYRPAGPGVIAMPHTPHALALHVQLCGFKLHEDERKVQRIDPVRGGRSFTSPGIWQDIRKPIPDADPVNEVVAAAAERQLSPAELMRAAEALKTQAEISAG